MEKARQLLVSATNIVLSPETVSTYLAQMWITNIMQTVGWGLIAAFTAKTAGRLAIHQILLSNFAIKLT